MSSIEKANNTWASQDDLYPYQDWAEIYGDLDKMRMDLIDECLEHLAELDTGTYTGRPISNELASEQAAGYREEIKALQELDQNDKEAVLQIMRMHIKRSNAAEDFINQA